MADSLASLRAEAKKKLTRHEQENLVLRAWSAALRSVRPTMPMTLRGCGDNSCIVAPPRGMATNGGCRCSERDLRMAVQHLKLMLSADMAREQEAELPEEI